MYVYTYNVSLKQLHFKDDYCSKSHESYNLHAHKFIHTCVVYKQCVYIYTYNYVL